MASEEVKAFSGKKIAASICLLAGVLYPAQTEDDLPSDAAKLVAQFQKDVNAIQSKAEQEISARKKKILQDLKALRDSYAKEGKYDEALAVHERIRSLRVERVEVEWRGVWWPAEVLRRQDGKAYIRYIGWEECWNEWVTKDRLRASQDAALKSTSGSACSLREDRDPSPLPSPGKLENMKATYHDSREEKEVTFAVPKKHWEKIWKTLLPATRDNQPAKWEEIGHLEVKLKSGGQFIVRLYATAKGPGAFAAGETFERRVYYRGGNSKQLRAALRAAYLDSRRKD